MLVNEAEQQWSAWQERVDRNPHSVAACPVEGNLMRACLGKVHKLRDQARGGKQAEPAAQSPSSGMHVCPICGHEVAMHRLNKAHQAKAHGLKVSSRTQLKFNRAIHARQFAHEESREHRPEERQYFASLSYPLVAFTSHVTPWYGMRYWTDSTHCRIGSLKVKRKVGISHRLS